MSVVDMFDHVSCFEQGGFTSAKMFYFMQASLVAREKGRISYLGGFESIEFGLLVISIHGFYIHIKQHAFLQSDPS